MSDNEFVQFPLRMTVAERRRLKLFAAARDTSANKLMMSAMERMIQEAGAAEERADRAVAA